MRLQLPKLFVGEPLVIQTDAPQYYRCSNDEMWRIHPSPLLRAAWYFSSLQMIIGWTSAVSGTSLLTLYVLTGRNQDS